MQKAQGTKLLWVKTTPVPTVPMYGRMQPNGTICNDTRVCLNPPRYDADVVLYNKAADVVMAKVRTTANCIMIDHFSAFESGLVAPFGA